MSLKPQIGYVSKEMSMDSTISKSQHTNQKHILKHGIDDGKSKHDAISETG